MVAVRNRWRRPWHLRNRKNRGQLGILLVVQHSRLLQSEWDLHLGDKVKPPSSRLRFVSDCLHHCYSPILFEPLWWALRKLAERI